MKNKDLNGCDEMMLGAINGEANLGDNSPQTRPEKKEKISVVELATSEFHLEQVTIG